jgi:thiamine biosynthesis protein ThiS
VAPVNDGANVFCNSFFWNGMEILVNGTPREVGDGFSIANLIKDMALTDKRIAVEVNLGIVPRSQHGTHVLQPGDRVEIVHAIGGG